MKWSEVHRDSPPGAAAEEEVERVLIKGCFTLLVCFALLYFALLCFALLCFTCLIDMSHVSLC